MSTNTAVVSVMRFILLLMFVGWLIVWILLPTKAYGYSWRPNLQGKLNSTYFGDKGTNLLLFSFPMMFIAALSCVYLHLIQKEKPSYSTYYSTSFASFWRRPASVKAPLGIVTTMELGFAVMFVALLVWSLTNYIHVGFAYLHNMYKKPVPGLKEKEWEAKFHYVSYWLGLTGNICLAFLFFPVTRGSSILALVGLTSESSMKYHIWLGHLSMVLFAAHSLGYIIFWAITHQMAEMLEWSKTYVSNVAGEIAIVFAMAMWVTSIPRVRRKMFELFFYTHQLYVLYIVFYVLHAGAFSFCTILPGIFLFIIDRYLRFLQSNQRAELLSARILPCETIELNFSKSQGLDYNPTSILFINVPSVSKMQWHPFTVNSNSNMEADKLSVVIKSLGSWSQKLYQQLSSNSMDHIQVSVEGPYGPTSSHFLRHKALVMISGGSGITPMISIIREIIFQSTKPDCHVTPVRFICAFKNSADLTMLQLMLPISITPFNFTQLQFQIEAYVTRETHKQPPSDPHKPLQTIWYKPDPLDSPISLVLGQNTWLWLGAIVSSSFVLFLFVLGIVNRFYIYPIDHNTGEHYHASFICLWYMFLICASIFIVSSAVFLWCKRQNAIEEGKRTQNAKLSTSTTDIELESSPHNHESLIAQATQVHYGTRPDLKKILLETKGSDIGVLVCGPRKMRHEVATVCSSSLAHNLHFESISFNW
ncbi:putative ferric-chelate reductase (NADH) [Rosa chinensis]|uniref:ferric-chelate reductase (NADH) n=1 Tax=Rosa chinensis TaxID=74649 RepID=A0A2P6SN91_ROSCH|nr:ferric reduction oxidase 4 [Rosa chinensis]PRQ60158.1 putative ferric-chelate reductase (NADH) [Rosa chinensis]